MRIILLKDIRGLGKKNEIKSVADGYAKNYLIPQNLAKDADKSALSELKNEIEAKKTKGQNQKEKLDSIISASKTNPVSIAIKTGKRGEVFGSVTRTDILKKLAERLNLDKETAEEIEITGLERPVKTPGTHRVELKLGGARGEIDVIVSGYE